MLRCRWSFSLVLVCFKFEPPHTTGLRTCSLTNTGVHRITSSQCSTTTASRSWMAASMARRRRLRCTRGHHTTPRRAVWPVWRLATGATSRHTPLPRRPSSFFPSPRRYPISWNGRSIILDGPAVPCSSTQSLASSQSCCQRCHVISSTRRTTYRHPSMGPTQRELQWEAS